LLLPEGTRRRFLLTALTVALVACGSGEPAAPSQAARAPAARRDHATGGTLLDRGDPAALRLVSYNVLWNTIFPEVDPRGAERFARLVRALDPDVLCLQEIGVHPRDYDRADARRWTAADVVELMNVHLPVVGGWHGFQGGDNVIVSRYPLQRTRSRTVPEPERAQAIALVDLPDARFARDLYVLNNHFKCCDPQQYDARRQQQADAIVAWLRDARTPGGELDLPGGTPLVVVGDLNIVGSFQPVRTLVEGDVIDEQRYGPDFAPDWDASELSDLHPRHNADPDGDDWTWRNDGDRFPPGRLDFVIYSDSVLQLVHALVLDTTTWSDQDLARAGLERHDVMVDAQGLVHDHLPLVVDWLVVPLDAQ
jgi:endonuclease/exonuclease/phosphatase family metal-dependent hydrolase